MSSWTATPFSSIEEAHQAAKVMGLGPSPLSTQGEGADALCTFSVLQGKRTILVAQRTSGPPAPVMQKEVGSKLTRRPVDPNAPRFHEHKRLGAGPWVESRHATLLEAAEHIERNVLNPPPPRTGLYACYPMGKGEFVEYLESEEGIVLARSLRPVYTYTQEEAK